VTIIKYVDDRIDRYLLQS